MRRTYPCYIGVSARQGQRFQNHLKAQAIALYAASKRDPFAELVFRYIISFTDLFNCMKMGEELSKDAKNEEQAIAGIRNDNVWQNSMCMLAVVTEYTHDAEVILDQVTIAKVDDISAVVVMDMASTLRFTDRTGFKLRYELIHECIKNGL